MNLQSPWHAGEKRLQAHVGVAERMEAFGPKVIRDHLPDQHRQFYQQLPFMLFGAVDADGNPWASILEGQPGFAHSPEPVLLQLDSLPRQDDPAQLQVGAAIGLLGIELHTRRRNRINGRVSDMAENGFTVTVEQSFGNCPQYIQLRQFESVPVADPSMRVVQRLSELDDAASAIIREADTFFVASYVDVENQRSVDVSHRGGQSGFVQVEGNYLTIPDFAGNLHFNTLGNLLLNPRAGLLFIDFTSGDLLQISGRTEIILEGPQVDAFQGAERLWKLHVEHVVRRPAALGLRWRFEGFSPNSRMTGTWEQAAARLQAEAFGPSTLHRVPDPKARPFDQPPAATTSVPVLFHRSAKEARWEPAGGSLLELAESRGLRPEFSCRGGSCGTCKTRLISGLVHYPQPPAELPDVGEVLICCAVPASGAEGQQPVVLDL